MHVVVILRLVPDASEELEVNSAQNDIDREWIGFQLCPFDDHALEEAILLKERAGAKVTALALAGTGVDKMLQSAVAKGADEVVRLEHSISDLRDSFAVAEALAAAIKSLSADVVLTGVLSPEDVLGQLAPTLAGKLRWPTVNAVSGVVAKSGKLEVRQEYSGGRSAQLLVALPAVLGIQAASQPPRYVAGSKLRQAMGTKINSVQAGSVTSGSVARVTSINVPSKVAGARMLEGKPDAIAAQVVKLLGEKSLLGSAV
jgi:electron transfer flavoprotein beta subunit